MTAAVDVVIVGAGPTGLTAAGHLARAGCTVVVLEKRLTPNPSSRAFATMARTLEVLDARGLADDLIRCGHRAPGVSIFAGARIDLTHIDSPYPFVLVTPQTDVDRTLAGYAHTQGAEIRRGVEVVGIDQDDDGVTVTAQTRDSSQVFLWRARYVVGADGAHSAVRRLLDVDFPGRTILSSLVLADVKLAYGPTGGGLTVGSTRDVLGFLAPYDRHDADGSWFRAMVWDRHHQVPDEVPADRAEIKGVLARAFAADLGLVDISSTSRFHCDERQVERYRQGRVFLAGDAAHVHSPMGGQGMNTGIQDAANLAWKIDAVLDGAADALLDTYHAERHPIGKRVLRQSGLMARGLTLRPRAARGIRNVLAPRPLRLPKIRDAVAGSFAGTGLRYPGTGLVGTRATQIPLTEGRLTERLRTPGFVLVRERGAPLVEGFDGQQGERSDDGTAVLVRPDGYIAWAGDSTNRAAWAAALPLTPSECGCRR